MSGILPLGCFWRSCFLGVFTFVAHPQLTYAQATAGTIRLAPCQIPSFDGQALCGSHRVFEDRRRKQGRLLHIAINVIPARDSISKEEPVFFLAGGPGQSAISLSAGVARLLAALRDRHDLVFVDQRGAGSSSPLNCESPPADAPLQRYFTDFLPADEVTACRRALERDANLTMYGTETAMDDLEEIRAALGYSRVHLLGVSYGTRAALVYLKRYPSNVRTVILNGAAPPTITMPLYYARDAQRSLDALLAACARTAVCRADFARIEEQFREILERLDKAPATASVKLGGRAEAERVVLTRNVFAEELRGLMYATGFLPLVPQVIAAAHGGNFEPFVQRVAARRRFIASRASMGLFLSITCAEDVAFIDGTAARAATANTFLGDYRIRQQQAACERWGVQRSVPDYRKPARSDVPALIVSGEFDPVTPKPWGDEVAATLPHSRHVIIANAAHGHFDRCVAQIIVAFITKGGTESVDTTCATSAVQMQFGAPVPAPDASSPS